MSTRALMACHVVLLSCSLTGCTIWSLPRTISKVQDRFAEAKVQQSSNSSGVTCGYSTMVSIDENGNGQRHTSCPKRVEVAELQPEQFCELTFASPGETAGSSTRHTTIAGRVISIDETNLVLVDAIKIDRQPTMKQSRSLVGRIPYLNRLYKDVAIFTMPVPIPGEVQVSRLSVLQATTIPPELWPSFQQDGFGRVGLDFDFDVQQVQ